MLPAKGKGRLTGAPISFSLSNKDQFRVVVLGSAAVGKTSMIKRFLKDEFVTGYKPTIEDIYHRHYKVDGRRLTLSILDTSGTFSFPAMRQLSITTGDAFVLVYSVEDEYSFEEVRNLRRQIIEQRGADKKTPIVIVANKSDISKERRVVDTLFAEKTVTIDWGLSYVEASAKENRNIVKIFKDLLLQTDVDVGSALYPSVSQGKAGIPQSQTWKQIHRLRDPGTKDGCVIA